MFADKPAKHLGAQFGHDLLKRVLAGGKLSFYFFVGGVGELVEKDRFFRGGQGDLLSVRVIKPIILAVAGHSLDRDAPGLGFFGQGKVGKLDVFINSNNVFSSVPDCGTLRPVEFAPSVLSEGENKIIFRTDRGNYLIDQIVVKTELEDPVAPT